MDRFRTPEKSTYFISGYIYDQDGVVVPLASLSSATLTLFDIETYEPGSSPVTGIINARDEQNVLNANNVAIYATSGLFQWTMQILDNIIVTRRRQVERHKAMFTFTWSGGSFNYECEIEVVNRRTVS